jgi:multidrug efflux pump subunit AcrA (membrane-fusion protein)
MAALLSLSFAVTYVASHREDWPESSPPIDPPQSPFSHTVAGAGVIEAQTENIAVGSPLPGVAVEVFVTVGQGVHQGEALFRLDDRAL